MRAGGVALDLSVVPIKFDPECKAAHLDGMLRGAMLEARQRATTLEHLYELEPLELVDVDGALSLDAIEGGASAVNPRGSART